MKKGKKPAKWKQEDVVAARKFFEDKISKLKAQISQFEQERRKLRIVCPNTIKKWGRCPCCGHNHLPRPGVGGMRNETPQV